MDKRVFITVLLCLGIMVFWNTVVMPPPPVVKKKPAPAATSRPAQHTLAPASPPTAAPAAASQPAPDFTEKTVRLDTPLFLADVTNDGGGLRALTLKQYKEGGRKRGEEKRPVELVAKAGAEALPTAVLAIAGRPFRFSEIGGEGGVARLSGQSDGLYVAATWQPTQDAHVLRFEATLENRSAAPLAVAPALFMNGVFNEAVAKDHSMFEPPPDKSVPLYLHGEELARHEPGDKAPAAAVSNLRWGGIDRQYFLIAAAPTQTQPMEVSFVEERDTRDPALMHLSTVLARPSVTLAPGEKLPLSFEVYAGPKASKLLKAPGRGFEEAIDYNVWGMPLGFLARPMLWILNTGYSFIHNYGLAIMFLTLVVKLLLLPVTQKSFESMQVMKELKPELDKIKQRFPNDREKQGMETMRLYKERKVNPFISGCLPALLQMPVYLALWRTLWAAVELYQQEFLWLPDLTAKDPYYILPVLLGGAMFLQQKLSPPAGDPQQQKIMLFVMPPMMTFFMISLPGGLVFYILVNTLLTIGQQAYISRKFSNAAARQRQGA